MNSMYFWAFSIPSAISWRNCTSADASSGFTSASPPNRGILIPSAISPSLSFALSTSVPKNDSSSSGGPSPFSAFIASRRSFPFLSDSSSAALRARASVGKSESLSAVDSVGMPTASPEEDADVTHHRAPRKPVLVRTGRDHHRSLSLNLQDLIAVDRESEIILNGPAKLPGPLVKHRVARNRNAAPVCQLEDVESLAFAVKF